MLKTKIYNNAFSFLAEISTDIIEVLDNKMNRVYINPAAARYTGVPLDSLVGLNVSANPLFPGIAGDYNDLVQLAAKQKSPVYMEVCTGTLTGNTYFRIELIPRLSGNSIESIFVIFKDITEITEKDLALNKINQKFTTVAEVILQPFVILLPLIQNDEIIDFVYDYINEEGCKVNGISREDTIGKKLLDLFPMHKALGTFDAFCEVFRTGRSFKEIIHYVGPAGKSTMDGYFTISCAKFHDGLVLTWQDITNVLTAQGEVMKSEQRLYSAFNANPVAMVLTNSEGKINSVNRRFRQLFGFTKKDVAGKNFRALNIATDEAGLEKIEIGIKQKETVSRYDLVAKDKYGNVLQILFSSVPVETVNSLNFLFTLVDMSKEKELERSLLQSLQEKDVLLKEIHHRVKNNLQIISSLLNLQSSVTGSREAQDILSETKNRVQSIALMHENLYKSKSFSEINLDEYVTEMLNRIHQTYSTPQKVITWVVEIKEINVDLKQCLSIGLIINELVTNCYKYAFNNKIGGEIMIKAFRTNSKSLEIIIADNGEGLPREVDITHPANLGLQLVTILTAQLDGKLTYRNNGGAEYKIIIPLDS